MSESDEQPSPHIKSMIERALAVSVGIINFFLVAVIALLGLTVLGFLFRLMSWAWGHNR